MICRDHARQGKDVGGVEDDLVGGDGADGVDDRLAQASAAGVVGIGDGERGKAQARLKSLRDSGQCRSGMASMTRATLHLGSSLNLRETRFGVAAFYRAGEVSRKT